MCRGCTPPVPESAWTVEKALRALKYHTKVLQHLLEKLDLPFLHVQELRLALRRPRRRACIRGEARWRTASWGAIYLAVEAKCAVWRHIRKSAAMGRPEGTAHAGHVKDEEAWTFGCLNSAEAELLSEVEVHLCAALRHLSRASQLVAASSATVEHLGTGPMSKDNGQVADPNSKSADYSEFSCSTCEDFNSDAYSSSDESTRHSPPDVEQLSDRRAARLAEVLHESFRRLTETMWVFLLRAEICDALLRGDVLQAAAWALRFLGIAEPWGLRKVQDLALNTLELANEYLSNSAIPTDGSTSYAWGSLRASCEVYLGAPIIPRFEVRFRQIVSRLADLGLRTTSPTERLESSLRALLEPREADMPRKFDGSGAILEAFRWNDDVYTAFHQAVALSAATHLDGCCQMEPCGAVLAGVEVVSSFGARRHDLLEVVSCVPETLPLPAAPELGRSLLDADRIEFSVSELRRCQAQLLQGLTPERCQEGTMQQSADTDKQAEQHGEEKDATSTASGTVMMAPQHEIQQADPPLVAEESKQESQQIAPPRPTSQHFREEMETQQVASQHAPAQEGNLQKSQDAENLLQDANISGRRLRPATLPPKPKALPGRQDKFSFEPKIRVLPMAPLLPRSLPEMPAHIAVAA